VFKKIHLVAGTRPNFMKIAPLWRAFKKVSRTQVKILHAGQHSRYSMSGTFFKEHELPDPHFKIKAKKGTHAQTTASIMVAYEKILLKDKPDMVIVVGDVDATLACSLATKKQKIFLGHVESGLRSGDRTMPEEINRILTDHLSDICWTTTPANLKNLRKEGIPKNRIKLVGNIMIDSLYFALNKIKNKVEKSSRKKNGLVTLHRPSNVDDKKRLGTILKNLENLGKKTKIIFPLHPRAKKNISKNLLKKYSRKIVFNPPYVHTRFIKTLLDSDFVITDSGEVHEEAAFLRLP